MAKRYPTAVGAQRVIKAVFRAVSGQKRQDGAIHVTQESEQMKYFDFLGPDLCSKWSLVRPDRRGTVQDDYRPSPAGAYMDSTPAMSATFGSTHSFPPQAILPHNSSHDNQPFGEDFNQAVGPHDSYFATNGAFTAVGNWMLGDWTADLDWMTADFGA